MIASGGYTAILCSWDPVVFDNSTNFESYGNDYDYGNWNETSDYGDGGSWNGTSDYGDSGSWNGSSIPWWALSSTTTEPSSRKRREINSTKRTLSKMNKKKINN